MASPRIKVRRVRFCIFGCGRNADSYEHAWPDWVIRAFAPGGGIDSTVDGEYTYVRDQKAIRVRCVCSQCNGGWMSQLEQSAIPPAGAMMQDIALTLDADQQRTLSRWAIKTAMVFEFLSTATRPLYYSDTERAMVRGNTLVDNTAVWLARSSRRSLDSRGIEAWWDVNNPAASAHGFATTLVYSRLALQILTVRPEANRRVLTVDQSGAWDSATVRIWPPNSAAEWPPAKSPDLAGPELDVFAKRWAKDARPAPRSVRGY